MARLFPKKKNILKASKQNKTSDFILPLLGYPKLFYQPYLVNAYLGDVDMYGHDPYNIYILMEYSGAMDYYEKEKAIEQHPSFEFSYSLFDELYAMYVIKLTDILEDDYDRFLEGKYSEFSKGARDLILRNRSSKSAMPKVFCKHKELRLFWERKLKCKLGRQEVWPIMNIDDEIFNKKQIESNQIRSEVRSEEQR